MRKNQIHNIDALKNRRKELRSSLTSAEAFLWLKLQKSQLEGRKFRRQHSFGNFVLDFYCSSEKLSIELDGTLHFTEEGIEYDRKRTQFLKSKGINEIRFENWEVFDRTDEVLEKIKSTFKINHPVLRTPLLKTGGEQKLKAAPTVFGTSLSFPRMRESRTPTCS